MIWRDAHGPSGDPSFTVPVGGEVLRLCRRGGASAEHAGEVAHAVAAYCSQWPGVSAWPENYLLLLASRALRAAGEHVAADALFDEVQADPRAAAVEESTRRFRSVPPGLWNAVSSRLVRADRWMSSGAERVWVVDLRRLRREEAGYMEMSFLQGLRTVIESVADAWDAEDGRGVLGIAGLAAHVGGAGSGRRAPAEVLAFCEAVLERLQARRGWSGKPRIMVLDGAPGPGRRAGRPGKRAVFGTAGH